MARLSTADSVGIDIYSADIPYFAPGESYANQPVCVRGTIEQDASSAL